MFHGLCEGKGREGKGKGSMKAGDGKVMGKE